MTNTTNGEYAISGSYKRINLETLGTTEDFKFLQISEEFTKKVSIFRYEPSSGDNLLEWFNRYQDIFEHKMSNLTDEIRIRLLLL